MKAMDKIIGYSNVKRELKQVADTLKNREAYESLGADFSLRLGDGIWLESMLVGPRRRFRQVLKKQ